MALVVHYEVGEHLDAFRPGHIPSQKQRYLMEASVRNISAVCLPEGGATPDTLECDMDQIIRFLEGIHGFYHVWGTQPDEILQRANHDIYIQWVPHLLFNDTSWLNGAADDKPYSWGDWIDIGCTEQGYDIVEGLVMHPIYGDGLTFLLPPDTEDPDNFSHTFYGDISRCYPRTDCELNHAFAVTERNNKPPFPDCLAACPKLQDCIEMPQE